jgi:hypothetical protein
MSRTFDIMMGKISIGDKPPTPPKPIRPKIKPARIVREVETADLLEWETIIRIAVPAKTAVCGVYFLLQGNRIVYVGQSGNVHVRLESHRREGTKKFDRYAIVECGAKKLDALEAKYIAKYSPKYNIMSNARNMAERVLDMTDVLQDTTEAKIMT